MESTTAPTESLPAFPSETLPPTVPNEQTSASTAPVQDSLFEKIKRSTSAVFEKHGVLYKKGGGRPRKDGQPNKLDIPLTAPAQALPAGPQAPIADNPPSFDAALVKRCVASVVKAFSGFAQSLIHRKALTQSGDAEFARKLTQDLAVTQPELDGLAELTEVCLRKYGVGTQYAPEIGLGCLLLGIGARYAAAFAALKPTAEKPGNVVPIKP